MKRKTYFIPNKEREGTCYFEFQVGEHKCPGFFKKGGPYWSDNSLYLCESTIAPFTYLIAGTHPNKTKGFDYFGITYIDQDDGEIMIANLRKFVELLGNGKSVYQALEIMKLYNSAVDGSWREEDGIAELDLTVLKNTAEELANWSERILTEHRMISILGL